MSQVVSSIPSGSFTHVHRSHTARLAASLIAAAVLIAVPASARAATPSWGTTVSGTVVFDMDLTATAPDVALQFYGLVIGADDTTIDLNGFAIDGDGIGGSIYNPGYDGVTITNGTIRNDADGLWHDGLAMLEPGEADGVDDAVISQVLFLDQAHNGAVHSCSQAAVWCDLCTDLEFTHNEIDNGGWLSMVAGSGGLVRENHWHDNALAALLLSDQPSVTVEKNLFDSVSTSPPCFDPSVRGESGAVGVHTNVDGLVFRRNVVRNSGAGSAGSYGGMAGSSPGLPGIGVRHVDAGDTLPGDHVATMSENCINNNEHGGVHQFDGTGAQSVVLNGNDLIANGDAEAPTDFGIKVENSASATNTVDMDATGNFWGIPGLGPQFDGAGNPGNGVIDMPSAGPTSVDSSGHVLATLGRCADLDASGTPDVVECGTRYVSLSGTDAANACLAAASPCLTLARAMDEACEGDTISLSAQTFVTDAQVVIDKDISIVGTNMSGSVLTPSASTGSSGDARAWMLVEAGVTLTLSTLTMDGSGFLIAEAVRFNGQGTVSNVGFTEIKFNESGPDYDGIGVAAIGDGPVDVSGSTFSAMGRTGAVYTGATTSGSTFSDNSYAGKGVGDFLDFMVDVSNGTTMGVVGNAAASVRGVSSLDSTVSAAILVANGGGAAPDVMVDANYASDSATGIAVGRDGADTSVAALTCNRVEGNDIGIEIIAANGASVTAGDSTIEGNLVGVDTTGVVALPIVDASTNFWGCPTGANTAGCDTSAGTVDVTPPASEEPLCVTCAGAGGDLDGDGVCNPLDNCLGQPNPGQENADGDARGDTCDPFPNDPDDDIDGDTISGEIDNCPDDANTDQKDIDSDGIGNVCDPEDGAGTLNLSKVGVRASTKPTGNGSVRLIALLADQTTGSELEYDMLPAPFMMPHAGPVSIVVTAGAFSSMVDFSGCVRKNSKKISCNAGNVKAGIKLLPQKQGIFPDTYKFRFKQKKMTVTDSPTSPVSVTITQPNSSIDRSDSISACTPKTGRLNCKEG